MASILAGLAARAQAHDRARIKEHDPAPLFIAQEIARCRKDAVYFINQYCKIQTRNDDGSFSVQPFHLWNFQARLVMSLQRGGHHQVLKARQLGVTTVCCGFADWLLLFKDNAQLLLLSKTEPDAKDLLGRIQATYYALPSWLRKIALPGEVWNTQVVSFTNGAIARAQASTGGAGRSKTNSFVLIDEADIMSDLEAVFGGVRPTVDGGGQLVMVSTSSGPGTFFAGEWDKATAHASSLKAVFFPWHVRPGRDLLWYQTATHGVASHIVKREYPATPEDAFTSAENLIYPEFSKSVHLDRTLRLEFRPRPPQGIIVRPDAPKPGLYIHTRYGTHRIVRLVAGQDWNQAVPGCALVLALAEDGTQIVIDGHYQAELPVVSADPEALTWVRVHEAFKDQYKVQDVWCDHDPENILSLQRASIPAQKANKDLDAGIAAVHAALARRLDTEGQPTGPPGLIIAGHLGFLATEFASYKWRKIGNLVTDTPVKQWDHGMDSLRYACLGLRGSQARIRTL